MGVEEEEGDMGRRGLTIGFRGERSLSGKRVRSSWICIYHKIVVSI